MPRAKPIGTAAMRMRGTGSCHSDGKVRQFGTFSAECLLRHAFLVSVAVVVMPRLSACGAWRMLNAVALQCLPVLTSDQQVVCQVYRGS